MIHLLQFFLYFTLLNLLARSSYAILSTNHVLKSEKPSSGLFHKIKAGKTVYLNDGEDFNSKISICDAEISSYEYCRVFINGIPSNSFIIERSNTIVTGHNRIKLSLPYEDPLIKVASNTSNVLIENLSMIDSSTVLSNRSVIEISGTNITNVAVRNCQFHNISKTQSRNFYPTGVIAVKGNGLNHADRIQNLVITENKISNVTSIFGSAILIAGNVEQWVVSWNDISEIMTTGIHIYGTCMQFDDNLITNQSYN